ncbi:hypothetical protein NMG60_11024439 [Bertholletia excelsa]
MHALQRDSSVIQVLSSSGFEYPQAPPPPPPRKLNFSAVNLFDRFRKIVMRLFFSLPPRRRRATVAVGVPRRSSCDRPEPPKTSCSYYYTSSSHYNEAIADCIEFINKSAQDGIGYGRKSDAMV